MRNRAQDLGHLPKSLAAVGELGVDYTLVFLDTREDVLIKRYSETRRRHPLSHGGLPLADAIALERSLVKPLAAIADRIIDSSDLNVHQLRRLVTTELALGIEPGLSLLFESFAYRRGVPADADFVFDARCLPNPHWEPRLRPLSGRDAAVREHLDNNRLMQDFVRSVSGFLTQWLVGATDRFAAASSENGVTNQVSTWAKSFFGVHYNRRARLGDHGHAELRQPLARDAILQA